MSLEIAIQKQFKNFTLDVAFTAEDTFMGLLGASGSGKSMTLKCIAGIETPDAGYIRINGKTVFDATQHINLPPQQRHCGFLFQTYALFPNMTVHDNIAIVLGTMPHDQKEACIIDLLHRFDVASVIHHYPRQLSGGQQQRVALARMIATQPEIMLFDEPFSALDGFLKSQVEDQVLSLLSTYHQTALFVSHNRDEVFKFCPTACIMHQGKVHRIGTSNELFITPQTVITAQLTGCKNIAACTIQDENHVYVPDWNITLQTNIPVPPQTTHVGIRAHHIKTQTKETQNSNSYSGIIQQQSTTPFAVCNTILLDGAKKTLIWEYSVDKGTAATENTSRNCRQFYIPPQAILLLQ